VKYVTMWCGYIGSLFLGVMLLSAPTSVSGQLKIAALMPMSGSLAEFGATSVQGAELAVEEINAAGGVLGGIKLEIKVVDTRSDPQAAVEAADSFLSEHSIVGMVGAMSSAVTLQLASDVTGLIQVPQISNASTAVSISTHDDADFLFRTTPNDAMQGEVLAQTVIEQGLTDVAVLYVDNDYGKGLTDVFRQKFSALGGKVSADTAFDPGGSSYQQQLALIRTDGAEALVVIAYPDDGIKIVRQSVSEDLFQRFIFSDSMRTEALVDAVPQQYLDGSIGTSPEAVPSAIRRDFVDAFEAAYGAPPSHPFVETAYDATYLLAMAVEKAYSESGQEIRDALRVVANPPGIPVRPGEFERVRKFLAADQDIDYFGVSGMQNFDEYGDVRGSIGVWTIRDGRIETLKRVRP